MHVPMGGAAHTARWGSCPSYRCGCSTTPLSSPVILQSSGCPSPRRSAVTHRSFSRVQH